jgi:hypothetical protein
MTDIDARPVILIVMQNVLIANDIEQTILEAWPDADVITVASVDAAEEAMTSHPRIEIAFLELDSATPPPSHLTDMVTRGGGKMVMLGYEQAAPSFSADWPKLDFPFTTDDLLGLLRRFLPMGLSR